MRTVGQDKLMASRRQGNDETQNVSEPAVQLAFMSISPHCVTFINLREASMGKPLIGILSAAALTSFATCAGAMPIAPPVAPTSGVEQVRLVCDEWGRCWRQPDYYRRYGYYGHRYDDDDWPYRRYQYGYGDYGPRWGGYGWRRGWHNDNEQGNDDEQ
jgi:hypothetical protein